MSSCNDMPSARNLEIEQGRTLDAKHDVPDVQGPNQARVLNSRRYNYKVAILA